MGLRFEALRTDEAAKARRPSPKNIDQVATFTGSAFQLDVPGHPLLVFAGDAFLWRSETEQNRMPLKGHFQGAVLDFGKGKRPARGLRVPESHVRCTGDERGGPS